VAAGTATAARRAAVNAAAEPDRAAPPPHPPGRAGEGVPVRYGARPWATRWTSTP
jgi:hypothetical protein